MAKVISTNIGEKVTIFHQGKEVQTGIYKYPVNEPVFLGKTDVNNDHVMDRRYHGGFDKACYLYPSENYLYWKKQFPHLQLEWGMFGENLTIEGLLEGDCNIGSIYQIGEAVVQISQPRQPCYKLGIRFKDAKMVKLFSKAPYPGIYVRVLTEGYVQMNDAIKLLESRTESISLTDVYALLMKTNSDKRLFERALNEPFLADSAMKDLRKIVKLQK